MLLLVVNRLPGFDKRRAFESPIRAEKGLKGKVGRKVKYKTTRHVFDGNLNLRRRRLASWYRREHIWVVHQLNGVSTGGTHGYGWTADDLLICGGKSKRIL